MPADKNLESSLSLLFTPPVVATVSAVVFLSKALACLWSSEANSGVSSGRKLSAQNLDGSVVVSFRAIRCLGVLGLLLVQLYLLTSETYAERTSETTYELLVYVYLLTISIPSIISIAHWRDMASRHITLILLADFSTHFVLDLWPYVTLSPKPRHPQEEPMIWLRCILMAICGIVIPTSMPRPDRRAQDPANESEQPRTKMSLLSRITYSYLDPVVFHANKIHDVTVDDLPVLPEEEKVESFVPRVFKEADPTQVTKKNGFAKAYLRVWRSDYFLCTLWTLLASMAEFLGIFGTRNILLYLETGNPPYNLRPWLWIIFVGFGPLISALLSTQYAQTGSKIDIEMESSFPYLIFVHALRIRLNANPVPTDTSKEPPVTGDSESASTANESATEAGQELPESMSPSTEEKEIAVEQQTRHLVGMINNLITSDLAGMQEAWHLVGIFASAVQLAVSIAMLYKLVGWSSLVGFALLVLLSPAPGYIGKLIARYGRETMAMTDKRVQAVTDSLNVLRMIKLFAWEPYILRRLSQYREDELRKIKINKILDATMDNLNQLLPAVAKMTTFALYLFSIVEMQTFRVMGSVPHVLRAKVHFDRYDDFLNETEILENTNPPDVNTVTDNGRDKIGFKNCTFSWNTFSGADLTSRDSVTSTPAVRGCRSFELRFDGEVLFKGGCLNLIVGPTASGKTSVLMALLGEMHYKPHVNDSWYRLPRRDGIAYAPQESWVLNKTLRDNILLGNPYDEERYREVLHCCALDEDIRLWEAGDLSEVGEKGVTLSGGQKARVTLARALYSRASILLLDDVLAALDVHTAKWVATKALQGGLVKGRTVILVTHKVALVVDIAEHVIDLGAHGTINAQGSVSDVLKHDKRLLTLLEKQKKDVEDESDTRHRKATDEDDHDVKTSGKLILAEEKPPGRVELTILRWYLGQIGNPVTWLIILISVFANRLSNVGQTWFINVWSSQYEEHSPSEVPVGRYIIFYGLIILCSLVTDALAKIIWSINSLSALQTIHHRLLESIFSATFRWFDTTPAGRIITRCTQDIGTIDGDFSFFVGYWIRMSVALFTFLGSAIFAMGWYAFFPALLITCLGSALGYVYVNCQLAIRRERSNAKAPIVGQVGAALNGLVCIRAYGAQEYFCEELRRQLDTATRVNMAFVGMNRWLAVRIDGLSGLFAAAITTYIVYGGTIDAGLAGFIISVVMSFTRDIIWWVRIYNMLEIQATSLERIVDYMRIEHEPQPAASGKPPAYWPSSGTLSVKNLSARYSEDSPEILRNISFEVAAGERIGIVGRTGAGKSSIALALLRTIPTTGTVIFDGVAIDRVNLDALRRSITLIPQQPELIAGSLRSNLDPFEEHSDAVLNDALKVAGLYDLRGSESLPRTEQSNSQEGNEQGSDKIGLYTVVDSGGTNLSLGQRQIVAIARAILRKSKILILDEATAAIDYETDKAIQRALRTEFSSDTTLITIAHRLQTVMDYDKIIVLDTGQIVEYDTPKNLLEMGSFMKALVEESEDRDELLKLASIDA